MNETLAAMAIGVVAAGLTGCGSGQQKGGDLADRLSAAKKNTGLMQSLGRLEQDVQMRWAQVRELEARSNAPALPASGTGGDLLPPQARAGECYARVFVPRQHRTATKTILKREGGTRIDTRPAKYADGRMEWRGILCETNTRPGVIKRPQAALKGAGYNPGATDGLIGRQTLDAVKGFQKANGMAQGQLTINTLRRLKVM